MAHASLIFDLNDDGCTGGCGAPGTSFGTVTLTGVDADTVHVSVDLNPAGVSFFIDTGAGYALTWNGPAGETVTNVAPALGFDFLGYDAGGYHTGGGFGDFLYAIECNAAPKDALDPALYCASAPGGGGGQNSHLSFDVNLSPALALADFTATDKGFYFTVDLIGPSGRTGVIGADTFTNQTCTPGTTDCNPDPRCTGASCDPTVPEPGTLALLGIGLGAAVRYRRRVAQTLA